MDNNRVVTYSLLAYINNSGIGMTDFSDIFVPLIKRVLSKMNDEGYNKGKDINEIKLKIDQTYYLDIPYPFLKRIINTIAAEINKDGVVRFQIYQDGSFIIKEYIFSDYEETITRQEKDVRDIDELYHQFLLLNGTDVDSQPSIFDYIDKNRTSLSKYFTGKNNQQDEIEFTLQAKFINCFKDNQTIYNILRRIYLGSVISSYLEFETEGKMLKEGIEFVLDTNFIISLLDLTTIESTHTCTKILNICKKLGYRVSVLDFTIEETKDLLRRTADNFDAVFLAKRINPESIYNACDRKKYKQTDLQRVSSNLEEILTNEIGVYIVQDTKSFRNIAKLSPEYEMFKNIRVNEWSALHDTTAVKYVQHKRGKKVKDFYDAKCWFVSNPHHEIKIVTNIGFISEIISAEDLVNILWLTNPNLKANIDVDDLSEIGLSRLVSSTLNASLPSAKLIRELDENIQKYAKDTISDKEIIRVSKRIANKTNDNLEELNKKASSNPSEFVKRLLEEARKDEEEEKSFKDNIKELIDKIKISVETRATEREKKIIESQQEKESILIEKQKEKEKELRIEQEIILVNQLTKKDVEMKNNLLVALKSAMEPIERTKNAFERDANNKAYRRLTIFILAPLLIAGIIYYRIGWNVFDTKSILIIIEIYLIQLWYFICKKKELTLNNFWTDLKENQLNKYYKKFQFDINEYNRLKSEINVIEKELKVIQNEDSGNNIGNSISIGINKNTKPLNGI